MLMLASLSGNPLAEKSCSLVRETKQLSEECFLEPECAEKCETVEEKKCRTEQEEVCRTVEEQQCDTVQVRQPHCTVKLPLQFVNLYNF